MLIVRFSCCYLIDVDQVLSFWDSNGFVSFSLLSQTLGAHRQGFAERRLVDAVELETLFLSKAFLVSAKAAIEVILLLLLLLLLVPW